MIKLTILKGVAQCRICLFILLVFSISAFTTITVYGVENTNTEAAVSDKFLIEKHDVYWEKLPERLVQYNNIILTKEMLFPYIEHIADKIEANKIKMDKNTYYSIIKHNASKLLSLLIMNEDVSNQYSETEDISNTCYFADTAPKIQKDSIKWRNGDMVKIHTNNFLNYLYQKIYDKISISDELIEKFYNNNMSKWHKKESLELYHVLIEQDNNMNSKDIKTVAENIFEKIKNGESLSKYAEIYNKNQSRNVGGYAGTFTKGELIPELDKVCWKLVPDNLNVPFLVKSDKGWHIIKVTRYFQEEYIPLETVKTEIENKLKHNETIDELNKLHTKSMKLSNKLINERV